MKEYLVRAVVLGVRRSGGGDRTVDLFTKELGRVAARLVGGAQTLSKFAPHADPLNLVTARLVKKTRYTVADLVTEDRFTALRRDTRRLASALIYLELLRVLLPRAEPEVRLWHEFVRALRLRRFDRRALLTLLGYDPLLARCEACGERHPCYFVPGVQTFLCGACRVKFPQGRVISIQPTWR